MKSERNTTLIKHLNKKRDFKVIYDGDDFGIYKYDSNRNAYVGEIGHIPMEAMIRAIEDEEYFIKLEII